MTISPKTMILVGMLMFGIVGLALMLNLKLKNGPHRVPNAQYLADVAAAVNKQLPMMVDNGIRLDRIETGPGDVLCYDYSLLNMGTNELDLPAFKTNLQQKLLENYKNMKGLRERKIELANKYRDQKGNFIFETDAQP
jgi:hypothetical protein